MKSILAEVKQGLENNTSAFQACDVAKGYQKAIDEFENFVRMGLAQKRGNQLMSSVDAQLYTQQAREQRDRL